MQERSRLCEQIVAARDSFHPSSSPDADYTARPLLDLDLAEIRGRSRSQIQTQLSLVADAEVRLLRVATAVVPHQFSRQTLLHAITHLPRCLRKGRDTVYRIDQDLLPALGSYDFLHSELSDLLQVGVVNFARML